MLTSALTGFTNVSQEEASSLCSCEATKAHIRENLSLFLSVQEERYQDPDLIETDPSLFVRMTIGQALSETDPTLLRPLILGLAVVVGSEVDQNWRSSHSEYSEVFEHLRSVELTPLEKLAGLCQLAELYTFFPETQDLAGDELLLAMISIAEEESLCSGLMAEVHAGLAGFYAEKERDAKEALTHADQAVKDLAAIVDPVARNGAIIRLSSAYNLAAIDGLSTYDRGIEVFRFFEPGDVATLRYAAAQLTFLFRQEGMLTEQLLTALTGFLLSSLDPVDSKMQALLAYKLGGTYCDLGMFEKCTWLLDLAAYYTIDLVGEKFNLLLASEVFTSTAMTHFYLHQPTDGMRFIGYARELARIFGAPVQQLVDPGEKETVKTLGSEKWRIIHFSTHALLASDMHELEAGIIVGKPDPKNGEDGVLRPYELGLLSLSAGLVSLSACETARGDLQPGEGVLSWARDFLAAGADSVIATLWKIPDRASSKLNKLLFEEYRESRDSATALRRAKKALIEQGMHPYYWAGHIAFAF